MASSRVSEIPSELKNHASMELDHLVCSYLKTGDEKIRTAMIEKIKASTNSVEGENNLNLIAEGSRKFKIETSPGFLYTSATGATVGIICAIGLHGLQRAPLVPAAITGVGGSMIYKKLTNGREDPVRSARAKEIGFISQIAKERLAQHLKNEIGSILEDAPPTDGLRKRR